MTTPQDPVVHFVQRTQANLDATDKWRERHPDVEFFEVTHLVNSLLGLIVVPSEMGTIDHVAQLDGKFSHEQIPSWNVRFRLRDGEEPAPAQLRPLLAGLRNSVAHCSHTYVNEGNDITGITFESRSDDRGRRSREETRLLWEVSFDLFNLRVFLSQLADGIVVARRRQLAVAGADPG